MTRISRPVRQNWATPAQLARITGDAQPRRRSRKLEQHFTDAVKRYAIRGGWLPYHTLRSRGSDPGFPDLVVLRGARLVVAELKIPPNTTTAWQDCWLTGWRILALLAGPHLSIEIYVWTPEDWCQIEAILT